MANYVYDLMKSGDFKKLEEDLLDIHKIFETNEFKEFVANKCLKELDLMSSSLLSNISEANVPADKLEEYKNNHKKEIGKDYIEISNDTTLTQAEMVWVSEKTRERYKDGISIAYIIEYGVGIIGSEDDDWATNVPSPSKHADGSWSFRKNDNLYLNVDGFNGKFIYQRLLDIVEDKFEDWVYEYIDLMEG